jgi:hypothetical protein
LPTHFAFARSFEGVYSAVMPEHGTRPQPQRLDEATDTPPDRDFTVQDLGRRRARRPVEDHRVACTGTTPTRRHLGGWPRTQTPEGWVKKIERGDGKVWVGFFHLWVTSKDGERLRRKKEKVLGPAAIPKHEALKKLAAYVQTFTREKPAETTVIRTYADLWRTFSGLKSGQWSQPFRETIRSVFATHVLPVIGKRWLEEISLSTLQLLVNQMAEDGYSKSSVRKVRLYLKASFDYAATITAARQVITRRWWETERAKYDLMVSEVVEAECQRGDPGVVARRQELLREVTLFPVNESTLEVARLLIAPGAIPAKAGPDAIHIAAAAVEECDFLLTWNFRHIANVPP